MIAPDLLKEMQLDGLIDPITDDIEPKPQPLPSNTILSDTKKMVNNQINQKKIIEPNQTSLIPEVSESLENAESISINHCSSSMGQINKKEKKNFIQNNINNNNYIKEEEQDEENDEKMSNNNYDNKDGINNNYNDDENKEMEVENSNEKDEPNKSQSSFTSFGRPKTEFVNTSLSTEGIEPLYYNTNQNYINGSLTPINQSKIQSNFSKNNNNRNYNNNHFNNNTFKKIKGKDIKDIKKLQYELNSLTKQFEKIDKSLKKKNEELKKIKLINDSLLKENNSQKKIIDSINSEKVMLNSKIISLKDYCNKMETKLISGSKNQHIIEINNKLRNENESLMNQLHFNESEKQDLMKQNELLNDEINILKKEFQSSLECKNNYNNNTNNNYNNVYNENKVSKIISELTQEKKKRISYEGDIQKLKDEINKKDLILRKKEEEIQSLNYGKTQMTTIIAHKENEIHNLTIERDSFQQHFQECNTQLRNLKEKVKDYDKIKKEGNEYEQTIITMTNKQGTNAQKLTEQYETIIKKYINENNSLKKENKELNNKFNEYELEKSTHLKEYNNALNDKNKYNQLFDKLVNKLTENVTTHFKKENENSEIYNKLNYDKEKSLKLINEIEALMN